MARDRLSAAPETKLAQPLAAKTAQAIASQRNPAVINSFLRFPRPAAQAGAAVAGGCAAPPGGRLHACCSAVSGIGGARRHTGQPWSIAPRPGSARSRSEEHTSELQ